MDSSSSIQMYRNYCAVSLRTPTFLVLIAGKGMECTLKILGINNIHRLSLYCQMQGAVPLVAPPYGGVTGSTTPCNNVVTDSVYVIHILLRNSLSFHSLCCYWSRLSLMGGGGVVHCNFYIF